MNYGVLVNVLWILPVMWLLGLSLYVYIRFRSDYWTDDLEELLRKKSEAATIRLGKQYAVKYLGESRVVVKLQAYKTKQDH